MAQYTINTTPMEELKLDFLLGRLNAWRAAQNPPLPALTKAQLVGLIFHERLASQFEETRNEDGSRVNSAFGEATESVKGQVRSLLGME